MSRGGAQERFGVTPDLTCLGKVIGGGMPVGCFGGKAKIINHIAPTGPIYQAGTLSGNPVAMAAGLAALSQLEEPDLYTSIFDNTQKLAEGLTALAHKHGIPMTYNVAGSMFGIFSRMQKKSLTINKPYLAIMYNSKRFITACLNKESTLRQPFLRRVLCPKHIQRTSLMRH